MDKTKILHYLSILFAVLLGLFLIRVFNLAYPINVITSERSTELSVVGEGKVEVTPDVSYIDVGVTVDNLPTVESAQSQIDGINNKILASLKAVGIPETDIKTSNYSINPNYDYTEARGRIIGYNGFVTLAVKVKDLSLISRVVQEATNAGANQVQGIRFVVDDPGKFREEARQKAIDNAREQAESIAKTLGIRLGKVTNFVESTGGGDMPPVYLERAADSVDLGGTADFSPGSQTITSTVTLYFEKK